MKREQKYVVFESSLVELLNFCRDCGASAKVRKNFVRGTFIELESVCSLCEDHRRVWRNQPVHNSLPVGNLLLAGAILFSGSSPVKAINMLKFNRIATFCLRTFFRLQKAYLLPAINSVWYDVQSEVLAEVSGPLKLGGDARCCSPGHTAKYGSYTLMDLQTSKVVDMQLIQVCYKHLFEMDTFNSDLLKHFSFAKLVRVSRERAINYYVPTDILSKHAPEFSYFQFYLFIHLTQLHVIICSKCFN